MKQVFISFDTTGSMYPALRETRRRISDSVKELFSRLPSLEIAIGAHGDYEEYHPDDVRVLDFTRNVDEILRFVDSVGRTRGGGNGGECYDSMLHEARSLSWKAGDAKVVVMIGDEPAHGWFTRSLTPKHDWQNELNLLLEAGITVYPVQALREHYTDRRNPNGRYDANIWYERVADISGGYLLQLDQFHNVVPLIEAVCYRQAGIPMLEAYEAEIKSAGLYEGRGIDAIFDTLADRKVHRTYNIDQHYTNAGLVPVPAGRFQTLAVINDASIKDFVNQFADGDFVLGAGFYELTKRVVVQPYKEVILQDKESGDFFTGDEARRIIGLRPQHPRGTGRNEKISPSHLPKCRVFIQSTSPNRKLLAGTKFLYEIQGQ